MRSVVQLSLITSLACGLLVGGCPAPTTGDSNANSSLNANTAPADDSNANTNGTTLFVGDSPSPDPGGDTPGGTPATNSNANAANTNANGGASNANDNTSDAANANANQNVNGGSSDGNSNSNSNVNTNSSTPVARAGRWQATIACTSTQSLSGVPSTPNTENITLEITFDAGGLLQSLTIVNFANGVDQVATLTNVGDVDTLTADNGGLDANLVVTLQQVTYNAGGAQITVGINYTGQQGALIQVGSGSQVLTVAPGGASLAYALDVTYNVNQQSGSIVLQTGEVIECDGTLTFVP